MNKRKTFILLTRFPDTGSKAIHFFTGFRYTHASIGLEEDMNTFYSFVVKGFIAEKITRYVRSDKALLPCLLYELEVSEEVYGRIKEVIRSFAEKKELLRYSRLGLVLSLFHISFGRQNYYFCSQFVAEVLKYSGAAYLKKDSELYLPCDFRNLQGVRKKFQGDLTGMVEQFNIT